MATTYSGAKVASTVQARAGIDITTVWAIYEVAVALVIDDIIQMVKVPSGATVTELVLSVDDLDSGTAILLDVGDGDDDDRYILGSTIGQAGGTVRLGSGVVSTSGANALNYTYTAEDTIDIHVDTAPSGSGVGTVAIAVTYTMQS